MRRAEENKWRTYSDFFNYLSIFAGGFSAFCSVAFMVLAVVFFIVGDNIKSLMSLAIMLSFAYINRETGRGK